MPVNLGEAIGLGSQQRIRSGEISQAANKFIQLDQGKRAAAAKREAEDQKYLDEINKSLIQRIGKLNNPRTQEAMQIVSEFALKTRPKDGRVNRFESDSEYERAYGMLKRLEKEQEIDDDNAKVFQSSRNAFGNLNVLDYENTVNNDPYLATILYEQSGTNVPRLRGVQYVNPTDYENKVVNTLEKQLMPTSTGKTIGTDIITVKKLTPADARNLAVAEIGDGSTDYAINLYVQNKDRVQKEANQMMRANPEMTGPAAINQALVNLASERFIQQGKFYGTAGTRQPRTSGGGKGLEDVGFTVGFQAEDLALQEQETAGGLAFRGQKQPQVGKGVSRKGDIVEFSRRSGKSVEDYKPYQTNGIPKITIPAINEAEKSTVYSGGGATISNTDILYFVQDPITRKWFAKVKDETIPRDLGVSKILSKSGYLELNDANINTMASGFKKNANELRALLRKAEGMIPNVKGKSVSSQPKQQTSGKKDSFPTWKSKNPNGTAAQYKQYLAS